MEVRTYGNVHAAAAVTNTRARASDVYRRKTYIILFKWVTVVFSYIIILCADED